MLHRGPDGLSHVRLEHGTLHHSLLAVHGQQRQPIRYKDTHVAYNGEIYAVEHDPHAMFMAEHDATYMAAGFVDDGEPFLHTLNGDWAMLTVRGDTVTAVRDRFGLRPLFRYWDGDVLVYASNIAIIAEALATRGIELEPSPAYPSSGRVPYPAAFRHVTPLPPATIETAVFDGEWKVSRRRWYQLHLRYHDELDALIRSATLLRSRHEHASVAVSGGVDSYLLSDAAPSSLSRYHLNVTGEAGLVGNAIVLEPPTLDAVEIAEVLEQPYYALPPNLFLAHAIRAHDHELRVVLTGIGADELFGGYAHHRETFSDWTWRGAYRTSAHRKCRDWREAELEYPIPFHYGYRTDQAFLRCGIEVRHPYLDHRIVETALCRPSDGKAQLRALAEARGWEPQSKRGFAADLREYVQGDVAVALAGLPGIAGS